MNQNRRYVLTLAAVALVILVVGSLLRPSQPTTDEPIPAPSQSELSRLAQLSQRRALDDMTEYFAIVADEAADGVLWLPSLNRSGLVWGAGLVLTVRTERRFPDAATLSTPTGDIGVVAVSAGPHLPIATLRISDPQRLQPPRRRSAAFLTAGAWMLALWHGDGEATFTPAHFLGTAPARCAGQLVDEVLSNIPWTRGMAGGGLFDLDGNLVGVIVPCAERVTAVAVADVETLLRQDQTLEGRLLRRYGLRLGSLSEAEQEHFGRGEEIVVREVWTEYPADVVGLAPGDFVIAVNDEPFASPSQLELLAEAAELDAFELVVDRGAALVDIQLPVDPSAFETLSDPTSAAGLMWRVPPVGHLIDAVVPESPADVAGIRAGDRLLRIDTIEPADVDQVRDVLSPDRETPAFVELERSGRRWGVLLP